MTLSTRPRFSRISRVLGVSTAVVAGSLGVSAPAAHAVPACDVAPAIGVTVTCTFNAGGFTDLVVPSGTESITIVAIGGSGGANPGLYSGGSGARVTSSTAVSAGQTLRVYVGGGGLSQGAGGAGYGTGGNTGAYGGGGGGSSAVLLNSTVVTVAGGGGGGGGGGAGGTAGGANGAGGSGQGQTNANGRPGAGGSAGTGGIALDSISPSATSGGDGFSGSGGSGNSGLGGAGSSSGAGGAGWGGGAGGGFVLDAPSTSGGGGAGGSYGPAAAVFSSAGNATVLANGANGTVQISFNGSASGQLPPDVLQGVGAPQSGCTSIDRPDLNWGGSASGGWSLSWAQWGNGGLGGFVCLRTLRYDATLLHWVVAA